VSLDVGVCCERGIGGRKGARLPGVEDLRRPERVHKVDIGLDDDAGADIDVVFVISAVATVLVLWETGFSSVAVAADLTLVG
jgi:hypothetical protein